MILKKQLARLLNEDGTPSTVTRVVYVEVPEEIGSSKKIKARKEIEDTVFSASDSIADNAKMISLILTMLSRIYDVLDETTKAKLDVNDRAMIEHTWTKFASTETRADVQFATEGISLVDKLLDRQAKVGEIVK